MGKVLRSSCVYEAWEAEGIQYKNSKHAAALTVEYVNGSEVLKHLLVSGCKFQYSYLLSAD